MYGDHRDLHVLTPSFPTRRSSDLLRERQPSIVFLENVRNLVGPRHESTWRTIISTLRSLGYRVSDTPTVFSPHLLPQECGGSPQVRERVFILGTYVGVEDRKSTRLNSSHSCAYRLPSSA